jgi:hypothetical protein
MEPMDLRRYQLPGPVHGRMTDPAAWRAAVDNSSAQLEAQRVRGVNLDAMIEYGPEMWRRHCGQLEYTMKVGDQFFENHKDCVPYYRSISRSSKHCSRT